MKDELWCSIGLKNAWEMLNATYPADEQSHGAKKHQRERSHVWAEYGEQRDSVVE